MTGRALETTVEGRIATDIPSRRPERAFVIWGLLRDLDSADRATGTRGPRRGAGVTARSQASASPHGPICG